MGQRVASVGVRRAVVLLDGAPDIEPNGDLFEANYSSGDAIFSVAVRPHDLLAWIEAATRAYNGWASSHREAQAIRSAPVKIGLQKGE